MRYRRWCILVSKLLVPILLLVIYVGCGRDSKEVDGVNDPRNPLVENRKWSQLHQWVEKKEIHKVRKLLKEDKVNPNVGAVEPELRKKTPLHIAVENKDLAMIKLLIEYKANVNAKDTTGLMPIHIAIKLQDKKIVGYLLEQDIDLNQESFFVHTPLEYAKKEGTPEIVEQIEVKLRSKSSNK